ncbi:unnamed protein product [Ectocarpus sp. CCAP 1310/34]|nr:unnamed protein product [Ectocarpus sp. CCAP 1310/34]
MVPQQQAAKSHKSGKGSERGPRMRCAILATGAFVKLSRWTKDTGELVPYTPTTTNCHAKKAVYDLMRYVGSVAIPDKDVQSERTW